MGDELLVMKEEDLFAVVETKKHAEKTK